MSASPLALVREDLRGFAGYKSARTDAVDGAIWLNANESPWANPADADGAVRRYPDPQPAALRSTLAALYGCTPAQLLAGRGSDEGIDLLVRALCRPGADAIVITTPTFGMYAVSARLHGTPVVDVPLREGDAGFACDLDAVREGALASGAKLVFLCSPGNPTGATLPHDGVLALARALEERAVVVVDEAYVEFADGVSFVDAVAGQRNLAVLRTLSKAHALAAARLGSVIADADLIAVLQRCQAPYPLPTPCVRLVEDGLDAVSLAATRARIDTVVGERARLTDALRDAPGVRRAYASQANFVLARFADAQSAYARLLAAGVVVRDMRHLPQLGDALRITVGTADQNARVIEALAAAPPAGAA